MKQNKKRTWRFAVQAVVTIPQIKIYKEIHNLKLCQIT